MSSLSVAVTALLAGALLIQPCPAPPAVIAIVGAAAAVNSATAAVGAAAVGAISGAVAGAVSKNVKRDVDAVCLQDAINAGMPQMQQMDDGSVMIYNVPTSCMATMNQWNQHPGINTFNENYGYITNISSSSVMMYNVPDTMSGTLQHVLNMVKPAPRRKQLEKVNNRGINANDF